VEVKNIHVRGPIEDEFSSGIELFEAFHGIEEGALKVEIVLKDPWEHVDFKSRLDRKAFLDWLIGTIEDWAECRNKNVEYICEASVLRAEQDLAVSLSPFPVSTCQLESMTSGMINPGQYFKRTVKPRLQNKFLESMYQAVSQIYDYSAEQGSLCQFLLRHCDRGI
jgi:hypothetical protein